jgi:hypothetical protein
MFQYKFSKYKKKNELCENVLLGGASTHDERTMSERMEAALQAREAARQARQAEAAEFARKSEEAARRMEVARQEREAARQARQAEAAEFARKSEEAARRMEATRQEREAARQVRKEEEAAAAARQASDTAAQFSKIDGIMEKLLSAEAEEDARRTSAAAAIRSLREELTARRLHEEEEARRLHEEEEEARRTSEAAARRTSEAVARRTSEAEKKAISRMRGMPDMPVDGFGQVDEYLLKNRFEFHPGDQEYEYYEDVDADDASKDIEEKIEKLAHIDAAHEAIEYTKQLKIKFDDLVKICKKHKYYHLESSHYHYLNPYIQIFIKNIISWQKTHIELYENYTHPINCKYCIGKQCFEIFETQNELVDSLITIFQVECTEKCDYDVDYGHTHEVCKLHV